ncbi:hypothetical protein predicted by Glimmer/Critica [Limosilactobacillus fermentum]|nr:hypothetical protein predicted by Glimmer/Critica [Limosilactobacillus fermentum]
MIHHHVAPGQAARYFLEEALATLPLTRINMTPGGQGVANQQKIL